MDRRNLIKKACGTGMCGCLCSGMLVSSFAETEQEKKKEPEEQKKPAPKDWRLGFAKTRYTSLIKVLYKQLGPDEFRNVIRQMGAECSKSIQMISNLKGKPDEYFKKLKSRWKEDSVWDKEKGIITITSAERTECTCPLIDTKKTPDYVCDCSLGWQKQTFKTILGKDVHVTIKESLLRGGKRCVFEITYKT